MSRFSPGKKAMFVQSNAGNVGKVVTLVEFVGQLDHLRFSPVGWWRVGEAVKFNDGSVRHFAPEEYLMPWPPDADDIGVPEDDELEAV